MKKPEDWKILLRVSAKIMRENLEAPPIKIDSLEQQLIW